MFQNVCANCGNFVWPFVQGRCRRRRRRPCLRRVSVIPWTPELAFHNLIHLNLNKVTDRHLFGAWYRRSRRCRRHYRHYKRLCRRRRFRLHSTLLSILHSYFQRNFCPLNNKTFHDSPPAELEFDESCWTWDLHVNDAWQKETSQGKITDAELHFWVQYALACATVCVCIYLPS